MLRCCKIRVAEVAPLRRLVEGMTPWSIGPRVLPAGLKGGETLAACPHQVMMSAALGPEASTLPVAPAATRSIQVIRSTTYARSLKAEVTRGGIGAGKLDGRSIKTPFRLQANITPCDHTPKVAGMHGHLVMFTAKVAS